MDDLGSDKARKASSLKAAIRSARVEEAERAQAVGDLRGAEVARLELLNEAIAPVLAQIPAGVDMFDAGIVPGGERPRLFIDMISFVEMGRDKRSYRFLQDTRNGRLVIAEADHPAAIVDAITNYIARRLVEREQILASLLADGTIPRAPGPAPKADADPVPAAVSPEAPETAPSGTIRRSTMRVLRIGIDALGVLALAGLFWLGLQFIQGHAQPPW